MRSCVPAHTPALYISSLLDDDPFDCSKYCVSRGWSPQMVWMLPYRIRSRLYGCSGMPGVKLIMLHAGSRHLLLLLVRTLDRSRCL